MPHISKNYVKKDVFAAITKEFAKTLLKLHSTEEDKDFLFEFFTHTERIMFAKRLAIIALLLKGMSPYRIQTTLKISPSTIARLQLKIQVGKLKRVVEVLKNSLRLKNFWEELEELLQMGMPPMGKGRSKWARKHFPLE